MEQACVDSAVPPGPASSMDSKQRGQQAGHCWWATSCDLRHPSGSRLLTLRAKSLTALPQPASQPARHTCSASEQSSSSRVSRALWRRITTRCTCSSSSSSSRGEHGELSTAACGIKQPGDRASAKGGCWWRSETAEGRGSCKGLPTARRSYGRACPAAA